MHFVGISDLQERASIVYGGFPQKRSLQPNDSSFPSLIQLNICCPVSWFAYKTEHNSRTRVTVFYNM